MKIDSMSSQSVNTVRASEVQSKVSDSNDPSFDMVDNDPSSKRDTLEDDKLIAKSVEQANTALDAYDKVIERSIHEKTKAVMYVLKDKKTNEVIKEFPPKKIQDMIAKMWEIAGLFIDEKA